MAKQTEKPGVSVEELCATLGVSTEGAMVSGGQIMNFREGWAKAIFTTGNLGHYFVRWPTHRLNKITGGAVDISKATSKCGVTVEVKNLYGIGNFRKCKRCQKSLDKRQGIS